MLVKKDVVARKALLEHTTNTLSDLDRDFLGAAPNLGKLEDTLKCMPLDCSPDPDAIIVEAIKACWEFIGKEVLTMILCF